MAQEILRIVLVYFLTGAVVSTLISVLDFIGIKKHCGKELKELKEQFTTKKLCLVIVFLWFKYLIIWPKVVIQRTVKVF